MNKFSSSLILRIIHSTNLPRASRISQSLSQMGRKLFPARKTENAYIIIIMDISLRAPSLVLTLSSSMPICLWWFAPLQPSLLRCPLCLCFSHGGSETTDYSNLLPAPAFVVSFHIDRFPEHPIGRRLEKCQGKARWFESGAEEGLRFEGEMCGGGNGEGDVRGERTRRRWRRRRRRRPRGGSGWRGGDGKPAGEVQGGGPDGGGNVPLQRWSGSDVGGCRPPGGQKRLVQLLLGHCPGN